MGEKTVGTYLSLVIQRAYNVEPKFKNHLQMRINKLRVVIIFGGWLD